MDKVKNELKESKKRMKKQYYEKNKADISIKRKEHYVKNKECILPKRQVYYVKHKENILAKRKLYYQKNRVKVLQLKNFENMFYNKGMLGHEYWYETQGSKLFATEPTLHMFRHSLGYCDEETAHPTRHAIDCVRTMPRIIIFISLWNQTQPSQRVKLSLCVAQKGMWCILTISSCTINHFLGSSEQTILVMSSARCVIWRTMRKS